MRWEDQRRSTNVEDRRASGGGGPRLAMGGGIGTIILVLIVLLLGGDPMALLGGGGGRGGGRGADPLDPGGLGFPTPGGGSSVAVDADPQERERAEFVKTILASTEDVWKDQFAKAGKRYQEPVLVMFRGQVQSHCGAATAAVGPFYCPADSKVYIDLGFFDELARRFKAPGDFAQAYVVAHEVGHHIQNLLGISDQVNSARQRMSETDYNRLSVRLELQADFLAGVWAHHAEKNKRWLEAGDIEEGLRAATAIGDDSIQKQTQGYVVPESFTHGSAEQRLRWFKKGLQTGNLDQGDTFNMPDP